MADINWLLAEIEAGPQGPEIGAFFDFDGTLIKGYSATAFFKERIKTRDIDAKEVFQTLVESVNIERHGKDVSDLMDIAVKAQQGKSLEYLEDFGNRLFNAKIAKMVYPDARILVDAHRAAGHTIVLASSATLPQVESAAEDFGIEHIVCTELEVVDGEFTGELASPVRWGEEKANGVRDFATEYGIDLTQSFCYSNGAEDVPFLKLAGNPRPLNPDEDLAAIAKQNKWPIARFKMPHRHNPITVARSVSAIGALGLGVAAGATTALINGDRRVGMGVAASVGSDLALAMAGVKLSVVGEANLWNHRPAVFLFNHQSQLDMLLLGALLRRDFTAVAKKELEHDPVFAPIGYLASVAYVDRKNSEKAREALAPVVEALRDGRSIAIAPEGTRSPTPRLLPFKKGAFHMAMQAGVPVVPIVMRNAGDIMRPHSLVISDGTVDVAVLKPISSKSWTTKNIGRQADRVRQLYLDTMAHWPTEESELL